jgi:hypothetical protein
MRRAAPGAATTPGSSAASRHGPLDLALGGQNGEPEREERAVDGCQLVSMAYFMIRSG